MLLLLCNPYFSILQYCIVVLYSIKTVILIYPCIVWLRKNLLSYHQYGANNTDTHYCEPWWFLPIPLAQVYELLSFELQTAQSGSTGETPLHTTTWYQHISEGGNTPSVRSDELAGWPFSRSLWIRHQWASSGSFPILVLWGPKVDRREDRHDGSNLRSKENQWERRRSCLHSSWQWQYCSWIFERSYDRTTKGVLLIAERRMRDRLFPSNRGQ